MKRNIWWKRTQLLMGVGSIIALIVLSFKFYISKGIIKNEVVVVTLLGWFFLGMLTPYWNHSLSKKRYRLELMNHNLDKLETIFANMDELVDEVLIADNLSRKTLLNLEGLSSLNDKLLQQITRLDGIRKSVKKEKVSMFFNPKKFLEEALPERKNANESLEKIRNLTTNELNLRKQGIKIKQLISKEQLKLLSRYNLEY